MTGFIFIVFLIVGTLFLGWLSSLVHKDADVTKEDMLDLKDWEQDTLKNA
jgi:hypothetical protein